MNEIIEKILEGNFDYDKGSLDFSYSKLEINLQGEEAVEGSFHIYADAGHAVQGMVYTSDVRMECLTPRFFGREEEIFYRFRPDGMAEGDVVKGDFTIISNQGEYYLPFVVTIEHQRVESSLGNIKNLFHFANLAKGNPAEAVSLFYKPEFSKIFNGNDKQYYAMYKMLSAYPGNEQNVEEFLLSINKKQRIEYLTEQKEIRMEDPEGLVCTTLNITKNGWGYARLSVETEGDFVYTEKKRLAEEDFPGNYCRVVVYVDGSFLHEGNNYGSIRLSSVHEELTIPVVVKCKTGTRNLRSTLTRQRLIAQLMEYYQAFRMKKLGMSVWLKETGRLIEKLTAMDERDVSARLFQAQLLITEERHNEAQWILDHAAGILENSDRDEPVLWAYYLYLTTLVNGASEYVDKVTGQVEKIYRANRREWRLAWLLLYLAEEYRKNPSKKLVFLEEQFSRGCYSPVLYIEALTLFNQNPSLLMKLGRFERQVLNYGAKKDFLHAEVIHQSVHLIQKARDYTDGIHKYLISCYRIQPTDNVLHEICSQLIKGNKTGPGYFFWYEKGVEKELRITRLYEYYMMSADLYGTDILPKRVLMYFSYQNNLDYERSAYLYANVYRNREKLSEIYDTYRNIIEEFALEQILKKRINRDLAYLYKNVVRPDMITPGVAEALAGILFTHQMQISRKDIRQVIVFQPMAETEQVYPVADGKALVPLFGNEYTVLLEDGERNRYASSVPYHLEKLMLPGKLAKKIAPFVTGQLGYDIYICFSEREFGEIHPENEGRFLNLFRSSYIREDYKREISVKLAAYYYENDKISELDEYLQQIDFSKLSGKEQGQILRYLLLRNMDEKAYEYVCRYAIYDAEPKVLLRLCNRRLEKTGFQKEDSITYILSNIFRRGKYDEKVLAYLIRHYEGMTKELRDIWKAAEAFDVNTYEICEKMLVQMLFTGAFIGEKMEVFKAYVNQSGKEEVEAAFLAQCAYDYFVKDKVTPDYVFEQIFKMHARGELLLKVSKLAMLKYYSEKVEEVQGPLRETLNLFLQEQLQEKVYLKYMQEYKDFELAVGKFTDKTILEYRAHPDARAVIHYIVDREDGQDGDYRTEEMTHVFGGVCFKTFILFFGERLQYYIIEERNGTEQLTESGTIQKNDIAGSLQDSKYSLINDSVIANTLQDYDTVDELLEEYYYKEFMQERLFRLL